MCACELLKKHVPDTGSFFIPAALQMVQHLAVRMGRCTPTYQQARWYLTQSGDTERRDIPRVFIHTCTPQVALKPPTKCAALEVTKATWTLLLTASVRTQPNLNYISQEGKQQFIAFLSRFVAPCRSHRTFLCRFKCLVAPITSWHTKQIKSPSYKFIV